MLEFWLSNHCKRKSLPIWWLSILGPSRRQLSKMDWLQSLKLDWTSSTQWWKRESQGPRPNDDKNWRNHMGPSGYHQRWAMEIQQTQAQRKVMKRRLPRNGCWHCDCSFSQWLGRREVCLSGAAYCHSAIRNLVWKIILARLGPWRDTAANNVRNLHQSRLRHHPCH